MSTTHRVHSDDPTRAGQDLLLVGTNSAGDRARLRATGIHVALLILDEPTTSPRRSSTR